MRKQNGQSGEQGLDGDGIRGTWWTWGPPCGEAMVKVAEKFELDSTDFGPHEFRVGGAHYAVKALQNLINQSARRIEHHTARKNASPKRRTKSSPRRLSLDRSRPWTHV